MRGGYKAPVGENRPKLPSTGSGVVAKSPIPRNPALSVDSITIKIGADIGDSLVGLEAIRAKLVEIEAQAERTAAALAKVKI